MTKVVNIKKAAYDVYIGRGGHGHDGYFGNPIPLLAGDPRGSTLDKYRAYFYARLDSDAEFKQRVIALKGKVLGCFCHPQPCHGDIIKNYLDSIPT